MLHLKQQSVVWQRALLVLSKQSTVSFILMDSAVFFPSPLPKQKFTACSEINQLLAHQVGVCIPRSRANI